MATAGLNKAPLTSWTEDIPTNKVNPIASPKKEFPDWDSVVATFKTTEASKNEKNSSAPNAKKLKDT